MKTTVQKLNNVIGQLEGIKKMLEGGRPCTDVLIQLKASKSALSSATTAYIEEHMAGRIEQLCTAQDAHEIHKLINELAK